MSAVASERRLPTARGALVWGVLGLAGMILALAVAWGFELVGGYVPCALCLQQRIPYYVAIPLALPAIWATTRGASAAGPLFLLAAATIAVSAGLGVYHAGAEWGFWPGPASCGGGETVTDAGNLLAAIEATRLVSCTEATGRFLGLSFAGWNVVAAGAAAIALGLAGAQRFARR